MFLCLVIWKASAASWEVHASKPSTHVLTPPKLGALREVARDNIFNFIKIQQLLTRLDGKTDRQRVIQIAPFLHFVETGTTN